jgi:hypothetical protein
MSCLALAANVRSMRQRDEDVAVAEQLCLIGGETVGFEAALIDGMIGRRVSREGMMCFWGARPRPGGHLSVHMRLS